MVRELSDQLMETQSNTVEDDSSNSDDPEDEAVEAAAASASRSASASAEKPSLAIGRFDGSFTNYMKPVTPTYPMSGGVGVQPQSLICQPLSLQHEDYQPTQQQPHSISHQPQLPQQQQPMINNYIQDQTPESSSFGNLLSPSELQPPQFPVASGNTSSHEILRPPVATVEDDDVGDETDEPTTDYSLRFQEADCEADLMDANSHSNNGVVGVPGAVPQAEDVDFVEAVRPYCSEGTPFDTPFIISNAGSVSDLAAAVSAEDTATAVATASSSTGEVVREGANYVNHQEDHSSSPYGFGQQNNYPRAVSGTASSGEAAAVVESDSKYASGLQTPASDRPRVYATEDTPTCFSRADSLSSLDSNDYGMGNNRNGDEKGQLEAAEGPAEKQDKSLTPPPIRDHAEVEQHDDETSSTTRSQQQQPKSVSFQPLQTPLMASPTLSLESLTSCDQQSIKTGYSSYVTSRATSGRVSPSDLPDSPCQTRPTSPPRPQIWRPRQSEAAAGSQNGFLPTEAVAVAAGVGASVTTAAASQPLAVGAEAQLGSQSNLTSNGVNTSGVGVGEAGLIEDIEDDERDAIKSYQVEGTPAILSGRGSPDDLTSGGVALEQDQHLSLKVSNSTHP